MRREMKKIQKRIDDRCYINEVETALWFNLQDQKPYFGQDKKPNKKQLIDAVYMSFLLKVLYVIRKDSGVLR